MPSHKQPRHVVDAHQDNFRARFTFDRRAMSACVVAAAALICSGFMEAVQAQAIRLVVVDIKAVGQGYQVSKLTGANVVNDTNEKIGSLDDIIVTQDRKLFGILEVGGFLGIGGHLVAVPYDSLSISDDGRKITLAGASKEALEALPEFHYEK